eukprot:scaffold8471_cov184-Amphora_coffeaeformis.AAC.6
MFDISWAELGVVTAVGIAVVGRKDLPLVARTAGYYTGKFVGWLQGMRTRADRFTAQNELAHLQGQVRSSMRQLQAVQAEVMSASSVQGSHLSRPPSFSSPSLSRSPSNYSNNPNLTTISPSPSLAINKTASSSTPTLTPTTTLNSDVSKNLPKDTLPPVSRTIAAVAESEWARQGLGFTSRAEMGNYTDSASSLPPGSVILAKALQESLVYDQYDRVMKEDQEALNPSSPTTNEGPSKPDSPPNR